MSRFCLALRRLTLLTAGLLLLNCHSGGEWTTRSPEALAEFQQGLEARMKLYGQDARAHFGRAAELDPDFVVAKLVLAQIEESKEKRKLLTEELRQADLTGLTERERFLVEFYLASWDERYEDAEQLLSAYLEKHHDDPFALSARCSAAWAEMDLERAEKYYLQLLDADPNWVLAQNNLGYIAMARGDFAQAEELFNTYKYIAPDQANPHDSLGELLTLLGRYEEARSELEEALRIKPDFCPSYQHLVEVALLEGRPEEAELTVNRAEQHCEEYFVDRLRCGAQLWSRFLARDPEGGWRIAEEGCAKQLGGADPLIHRFAVSTGRMDEALAIEEKLRDRLSRAAQQHGGKSEEASPNLLHMEAVRLEAEGTTSEAIELFQKADEQFSYWGNGQGLLKLFNQYSLARAYREVGNEAAAQAALERVRSVNPRFLQALGGQEPL